MKNVGCSSFRRCPFAVFFPRVRQLAHAGLAGGGGGADSDRFVEPAAVPRDAFGGDGVPAGRRPGNPAANAHGGMVASGLRTAAGPLVVLAAAEPLLQSRFVTPGASNPPSARVRRLLLDGVSAGRQDAIRAHKEIAARIVEGDSEGDGFTLVLLGQPPRVVVGTPSFDARDFLKKIQALELPHAGTDLPQTLVEVEKVLNNARRETSRLTRRRSTSCTDLGRVGGAGTPRLGRPCRVPQKRGPPHWPMPRALTVINLGQPDAENIAVTDLETVESFATPAKPLEIRAVVSKNFGRQSTSGSPWKFGPTSRRMDQQYIDLPPGGEATVTFSHRFDSPGEHVLEVRRRRGSAGEIDNQRWLRSSGQPVSSRVMRGRAPLG